MLSNLFTATTTVSVFSVVAAAQNLGVWTPAGSAGVVCIHTLQIPGNKLVCNERPHSKYPTNPLTNGMISTEIDLLNGASISSFTQWTSKFTPLQMDTSAFCGGHAQMSNGAPSGWRRLNASETTLRTNITRQKLVNGHVLCNSCIAFPFMLYPMVFTMPSERVFLDDLPNPRVMIDSIILPDGKILYVNGAGGGVSGGDAGIVQDAYNPVMTPNLFDPEAPAGKQFSDGTCYQLPSISLWSDIGRVRTRYYTDQK
ncbi:hypothetical protein BSLG_005877 [Batrachochytrium salamandrivorans]|nr:hypothetical protein BSLG_005877 [Batrachochytrium salamandrivorans]